MFENLFNQTLEMLSPDGDDDTIKFGGVEVPVADLPEATVEAIKKAQETYNASSTAGIESAKNLKDMALELKTLKESKPSDKGGLTAEQVKEIMKTEIGDLKNIADRGRQFNLNREIEQTTKELRKEFSYLDDDTFNEAMKTVDLTFKNQEDSVRSGVMYQNIAKITLGDSLRKNIDSVNTEQASALLAKDPEAMKKLIDDYSKIMGIDINMPEGGSTNQKAFEEQIQSLESDFAKERDPNKRGAIVQRLADTREQGIKMGFKL